MQPQTVQFSRPPASTTTSEMLKCQVSWSVLSAFYQLILVNSSCLATQYSSLSISCFKIGSCVFDQLEAYKSGLLNESTTEFWISPNDTDSCFTKTSVGSLMTIAANLSYDLDTDSCKQNHENIQLGVSCKILKPFIVL